MGNPRPDPTPAGVQGGWASTQSPPGEWWEPWFMCPHGLGPAVHVPMSGGTPKS